MLVLGIETSCDETAAAVVRDGREIVSSVISSQVPIHKRYGGVVPELASREHLDKIVPVVVEAFERSGVTAKGHRRHRSHCRTRSRRLVACRRLLRKGNGVRAWQTIRRR
jgi:hypothetical protein